MIFFSFFTPEPVKFHALFCEPRLDFFSFVKVTTSCFLIDLLSPSNQNEDLIKEIFGSTDLKTPGNEKTQFFSFNKYYLYKF